MRKTRMTFKSWVVVLGAVTGVCVLALLARFLITGQGVGLWRVTNAGRAALNVGQAILHRQDIVRHNQGNFTNVIFLHHSVGGALVVQGGVREQLSAAGFSFWDQSYTAEKLRGPEGIRFGYSYIIPDDNTDPDGLARIFAQPTYGLPLNAFSGLLQHEVIVFKSCFPVSHIMSDEQLQTYQSYYRAMRTVMDRHRDRLFIVVTPPPLHPASTDAQAAARTRAFANWLKSAEYLSGHPNIVTFDLFGYLAEDNSALPGYNMLRAAYQEGTDSHPNRKANETVGPVFADFIVGAAQSYRTAYKP